MKDAQKPNHVNLTTLVNRLREGRFVIPDFQRDFEWEPWDISALMSSIFRDYYISSLLLWKGKDENFDALSCEPIYAYFGDGSPEYIVLDGQQRLTAMYYAFMAPEAPAPRRANRFRYFIRVDKFVDEAFDDAFTYYWTQRGENLIKDPHRQYKEHMFPLSVIGKTGWALPNWVQAYERYWENEARKAHERGESDSEREAVRNTESARYFGDHLRGITEQYQVAYIELDSDLELDKVCDIFTQVNSRGVRLDVFDLINAMLRPKGLQLRYMWREAEPRLNFVNTDRMNVYVLQVMSILRQAYCSPKYLYYLLPGQERQVREPDGTLRREVLIPDKADFERSWNEAVVALEKAIDLLRHPQDFGAVASRYLPYVAILPAFAALQTEARNLPDFSQLDAQLKIRQWYWASVFLNRYSGSVESTSARDYQDVKAWFNNDTAEPELIGEFRERFRTIDLRRETRSGTSVYNAIFNLLVLNGARDWSTGNVPQHDELDDHHIVPKSWGKENRLGNHIDCILNRTPITGATNRDVIRSQLPNEYLHKLISENGESTVRKVFESHFISPAAFDILLKDPFTEHDFDQFLTERQRTIQDAIEDLLVKSRLDLTPRLREMDAQIEEVELALRKLIAEGLYDDPTNLPGHVHAKIKERLQIAIRTNPALDLSGYVTVTDQLNFADLRELQDTIANKSLWPRFSDRFGTKEGLSMRFHQLAELRNSIRHSRDVDEVTRKDGEAAILWFTGILV
ncbi:MAG: DUF262 domain-containing protein [Gemmatimonadetes bacterium]|nr:DUF262 domain-containing protein [Gemmatimonadota bacterium]